MSEFSNEIEHIARDWDKLARQQVPLAQPATNADLSDPLAKVDPLGWLGSSIRNKQVLCLAAGGGRHDTLYAAAGAKVTVVDISGEMLALDRAVAAEHGLALHTVQTSMESLLREVHERMVVGSVVKEYYTTQEVARRLGKRPYTVREWCRLGRVHGEKSHSRRGLDDEWRISHAELVRIENEGLLSLTSERAVTAARAMAAGVAVRTETMPEDMPASKTLPASCRQRPLEVVLRFVGSEGPGSSIAEVGKGGRTPWVNIQPCGQYLFKLCRELNTPGAKLSPHPLLFANQHCLGAKVDVVDLRADDLAAACPGVGGEVDHRMNKRLQSAFTNRLQEFVDLRQRQEHAIPQISLLSRSESAPLDAGFDFGHGLEGWFLVELWIAQAPVG